MAVDVFLKINGIPGESADSKHPAEIDVLSYSFGITQTGTMSYGGGGGAGKANFGDFSFMMRMNKATPKLMQACSGGSHIPDAVLVCRKAGDKQQEYMNYKFYDLLISSYQTSASSEEPTESISFNYSKLEMEYKEQDSKGNLGGATNFKYDIKGNKSY
ncbi:MAG: type VI secretion system tube protein Hcp [Bryobacteraceae bacterium]|nr:type VI secretion system tube protein Hcp [Bryobacteraceae bacterium]